MRIVHIADLHLGYRAYNKLDQNGINVREKDVMKAFQETLEKTAEIKPDLIVMAGDIFHRPRPSNFTIFVTIKLLQKFRQICDAPIIMIAGNHEAVKSTESGSILNIFETVISKVKVVNDIIQEIPVDNLNTSVLCVPHGGLANLEETDLRPNKDYKYNIMVIHGTYENCPELVGYGNGAIIKKDNIIQPEWGYIAFGHYHGFTELAPNTYYAGSIERTTTNIWQEAKDKKGFIEFDLDKKECKFHALKSPRQVIDVKRINALDLSAEEINQKILDEVAKIKDLDNSIIRITVENVDHIAIRNLDYKKIREFKKIAVHFRLNLIRKDSVIKTVDAGTVEKRKGIYDYLEEELEQYELNQSLDKGKFGQLAKEYLEHSIV
ncbi:MAG: exonuclease [uncultured bacterium]|nr:MAG: exonuclease [uncultured bacterium]HBH18475.1 DNA repair exonuclease [Cyanobacteria bacterium UBA9579]